MVNGKMCAPCSFDLFIKLCLLLFVTLTMMFGRAESADEYDCTGELSGVCNLPDTCLDDFFTNCPIPGSSCCPDLVSEYTYGTVESTLNTESPESIGNLTLKDTPHNAETRLTKCRLTKKCKSLGGFCTNKKEECGGRIFKNGCTKKSCFCCVPAVTQDTCVVTGLPGVVCEKPQTCEGYASESDGVYEICPISNCPPVKVRCIDSGWTVIFSRDIKSTPTCNFARGWKDYKQGFCDASRDYWLGNEIVHTLTSNHYTGWPYYQYYYKMKLVGRTSSDEEKFMKYDQFFIYSESNKYMLYADSFDYSSDAPDQFSNPQNSYLKLTYMAFTTSDRDNDLRANMNCADLNDGGGWWFNSCSGLLLTKKSPLQWYYWGPSKYGPVEVEKVYMAIKPN